MRDTTGNGSRVEGLRRALRPVIHGDRPRQAVHRPVAIQRRRSVRPGDPLDHRSQRALATPRINHRQHPKRLPVRQLVVDEIHPPPPSQAGHGRHRSAMERPLATLPDPQPQLQRLEPVQPPDPLQVHPPPLASQQDNDAVVPEAWPRLGELPNAQAERPLVFCLARPIPRRQTTRPHATHRKRGRQPRRSRAPPRRRQTFVRSASASICLSSVKSATTGFSR